MCVADRTKKNHPAKTVKITSSTPTRSIAGQTAVAATTGPTIWVHNICFCTCACACPCPRMYVQSAPMHTYAILFSVCAYFFLYKLTFSVRPSVFGVFILLVVCHTTTVPAILFTYSSYVSLLPCSVARFDPRQLRAGHLLVAPFATDRSFRKLS
jgi:hypothetical protein